MSRLIGILNYLIAFGAMVGCAASAAPVVAEPTQARATTQQPARLPPDQVEAARQALVAWFECDECEERQLQAVLRYGEAIVPSLRATLLNGPAPASVELLKRELEKRYDELQAYAKAHPANKVEVSKSEFVARYIGNFRAQYRTRAAQALGAIGTESARAALEEGLKRADRADIRFAIQEALALAGKQPK